MNDRAPAGDGVLAGEAHRAVDVLDVLAVDLHRLHPVCERRFSISSTASGSCCVRRRRLRPAVVLEHEDGRKLPELREVHRLVERARVGGAVAEERDRDARLVLQLERQGCTGDLRQAAADHGVRADVALLDVVEVHRAAEAARAALPPSRTSRP